jgi:dienelactone hydrolase
MGLNDYAKQRARQLAESGYVALAVDMYGGGKIAGDTAEAQALSGALKQDRPELRRRIRAAMDALKKDPRVNTNLVAAIGYCFGGTTVLELARSGADLRCVVSFHGALDTPLPAAPGGLRASVLVCHGADDPFVPAKEVEAFEQEMRAARADWQLVVYGGAVHSFTNPGAGDDPAKGAAYNEPAERRSWQAMRTFLREKLGPVE